MYDQSSVPLVGETGRFTGRKVAVARFSKIAFENFLKGVFGAVQVNQGRLPLDAKLIGIRLDPSGAVDFLIQSETFKPVMGGEIPFTPDIVFTAIGKRTLRKLAHETPEQA